MAQNHTVHLLRKWPLTSVAGALLGLQTGREVIVEVVFELAFTDTGFVDEDFLSHRLDQCPQPLNSWKGTS